MIGTFAAGFEWTMRLISCIAGGVTAFFLFALLVLVVTMVAGSIFDAITERIARRWEKKNRQPSHILGQIIMRRRRGKSDEI